MPKSKGKNNTNNSKPDSIGSLSQMGTEERLQTKQQLVSTLSSGIHKNIDGGFKSPIKKDMLVRGTKRLSKLCNHPKNKNISLINNGKYTAFMVTKNGKQKVYSGLTRRLKKVFYPELEEDPMAKTKGSEEAERAKIKSAFYKPSTLKRTCPTYGRAHGETVHQQIELYTNCVVIGKGYEEFVEKCPDPDPCVLRIIGALNKKQWIPFLAEQAIWDDESVVATSIDLVALSAEGQLILLEFKNGYEGEIYWPTPFDKKFGAPLQAITNCPMTRHMLQLISMDMILRRKYGVVMDQKYVVRMLSKEGGVELIKPPPWCEVKAYKEHIYDMLVSSGK
jgi:hypothetical protein